MGITQLPKQGYRVFLGVKAAEACRWPPTQFITEFNEKVELYLYSPYGLSRSVIGWTELKVMNIHMFKTLASLT